MSARARRLVVPLALLVAAGCSSPTEAVLHGEAYALTSVGGEALPTILFQNEGTTVVVLGDTLRFFPDGHGTHVRYQEVTEAGDPTSPHAQTIESEFGYGITGERIEITFVCPAWASCVAGPHLVGVIAGGTVRLDSNFTAGAGEHVYELVDQG